MLPKEENGGYIDHLVRASMMLVSMEHHSEIRQHGLKIVRHLRTFRSNEIMIMSKDSLNFNGPELYCLKPYMNGGAVDEFFELLGPVHTMDQNGTGGSAGVADHSKEINWSAVGPSKLDMSEETRCHLVEEHNLLCEAFILVASCTWLHDNTELLFCMLSPLPKIWNQSEWMTNLMHYFADTQFRKSVHKVALFFEKQLKRCTSDKSNGTDLEGKSNYSSLMMLLPLILPHLLLLLQNVHSLCPNEFASHISEELEGAKTIKSSVKSCDIAEEAACEAELIENEIRRWLQNVREIGYNVIGMCSYLEGAFDKLLDNTFFSDAFMKNVESMDFRHLTIFIKYSIIPMVKNCPSELWMKWIDILLQPVFHYCESTLFNSWCSLLYTDKVEIPDNFGDISFSYESVEKLKVDLLLGLTREASNLLFAVASPGLNAGTEHPTSSNLKYIGSNSLVGYLLYQDGLNHSILQLITHAFGYWTDGEARITATQFCRCLIRLAIVTHNDELISFIKDNIVPNIIRCLILKEISVSEKSALKALCQDAYCCIFYQKFIDESTPEMFKKWLSLQETMVRYENESVDELEEFVFIWEIEQEFRSSLCTYTSMLHEVHTFGDALEDDCFHLNSFPKLANEFISKKDVDSCNLYNISNMLSRKLSSEHWKRQNLQMLKFISKLITFKPYIKDGMQHSCYDRAVQNLLENDSEEWPILIGFNRRSALVILCKILELWEPQFHPLIREGHQDKLKQIAYELIFVEFMDTFQPFQPDSADFPVHLQPYAQHYFDANIPRYHKEKEQAKLHQEFDMHLASGALDPCIRQGDASRDHFDNDILRDRFLVLDRDLIKMSLKRRAELLDEEDQLCLYYKHMETVVTNEQLRNGLKSLIDELAAEEFFLVDNDIQWGNKQISELVDKFNNDVFAGLNLPKYYVIRGIMDLQKMFSMQDRTLEDAFAMVVGGPCHRWKASSHLFQMDTWHYDHEYYGVLKEPVEEWKKMLVTKDQARMEDTILKLQKGLAAL